MTREKGIKWILLGVRRGKIENFLSLQTKDVWKKYCVALILKLVHLVAPNYSSDMRLFLKQNAHKICKSANFVGIPDFNVFLKL